MRPWSVRPPAMTWCQWSRATWRSTAAGRRLPYEDRQGDLLFHLDPGEACDCREPKLVTYADWEAAGSFEKAARPGDAVEERIVDEFLNCLPLVRQERGFVQCGEPYSHEYDPETGHWRATFATFQKQGEAWYYCGNCFAGKSTEPKKAQIRGVL